MRDRRTGSTTLVSRATGATGAKGNAVSAIPSISGDGRRVSFTTLATNLDAADTDSTADVYVRDLAASTTTLVTRRTGADGAKFAGNTSNSALSGDGMRVLFTASGGTDGTASHAYVRDLGSHETMLVDRATGADGEPADSDSIGAAISENGRVVSFWTVATNLDPADVDSVSDVYVRDVVENTTTLVSRGTGTAGAKGDGPSTGPVVSADGRVVAFASASGNLDAADGDSVIDVFVRRLDTDETSLASRADDDGTKGDARSPARRVALSGDGGQVVFDSLASNLVPGDGDAMDDVFVRVATQLAVAGVDPPGARRRSAVVVEVTGAGFDAGAGVSFGPGIAVDRVTVVSPTTLSVAIAVAHDADPGPRTVTVTNASGRTASAAAFEVLHCAAPPPAGRAGEVLAGRTTCGDRRIG